MIVTSGSDGKDSNEHTEDCALIGARNKVIKIKVIVLSIATRNSLFRVLIRVSEPPSFRCEEKKRAHILVKSKHRLDGERLHSSFLANPLRIFVS